MKGLVDKLIKSIISLKIKNINKILNARKNPFSWKHNELNKLLSILENKNIQELLFELIKKYPFSWKSKLEYFIFSDGDCRGLKKFINECLKGNFSKEINNGE